MKPAATHTYNPSGSSLTDHLGNVMAVYSDRKIGVDTDSDGYVNHYVPDIIAVYDYYPFGFPMPDRSFYMGGYRYFFNGQESDAEVYGTGSLAGYEFRQYDTRLGRWWGVDQEIAETPSLSPFIAFRDNPILYVDPDGRKEFITVVFQSNTGPKVVLQRQVSNRIMTDGVQHMKVSKLSSATWHYENYYYDYEHVFVVTVNPEGGFSFKYQSTNIISDSKIKDTEKVWFGGDKYGDSKQDPSEKVLSQPGGWHLVTSNGGSSPTRYISSKGMPEFINVELLLKAMNGAGAMKGPLPDMRNNPLDRAFFINLLKDITQEAVEMTKKEREEYENETVVVTYTVDDGDGRWHQEGRSGVSRKDSASTAKKLSEERNAK